MSLAYLLLFSGLSVILAIQDWKTTYVSFPGLIILACLGFAASLSSPYPIPGIEHVLGGGIAAFIGVFTAWFMKRLTGRTAFGEADIWLLAAGGALVGLQWVAILFGLVSLLGLLAYPLAKRADDEEEGTIMPLIPILVISTLILAWGQYTTLLPYSVLL